MADAQSNWQSEAVATAFLEDVRGGIPQAVLQLELIASVLEAWCPPAGRILDLGCGDGALGRYLLACRPEARAVFVDFSEPMLEAARDRLGTTDRAAVVQADVATPGWLEALAGCGPFDAVVSGFVIHHLPDARKRALYGEIRTVLADGGVFLNLEHVASSTAAVEHLHHDHFLDSVFRYQQRTGTATTREALARAYATRATRDENILAPVEDQCRWLRELGFADVDCFFKLFELAIFGGRKAV